VQKDRASLDYLRAAYGRNARLVEKNAVSKDAYEASRSQFEQGEAQVQLDEAIISQRVAQLATAEVNLGFTDIKSPVDGIVVSRNVTIGQTVAASFQTPTLFLIATDLTKMQVDANVSESDIGQIREGNAAYFTVDAFPKRTFEGKVTQVRQSPQTVQNVVTYDVVITSDNLDLSLKPGMTASTRIVVASHDNAKRVPVGALRFRPRNVEALRPADATETEIWVMRGGLPARLAVTTGLTDERHVEIIAGDLNENDTLIVGETDANTGSRGTASPGLRLSR
jgi:HlyD family secretion protein